MASVGSRPSRRVARASAVSRLDALVRGSGEMGGLLRAAPLHVLTADCAACFSTSAGGAADYNKSQPVDEIDVFVSHSWAAERASKYLALSLWFDAPLALAVAAAFALAAFVMQVGTARLTPARTVGVRAPPTLYCSGCALLAFVFLIGLLPAARRTAFARGGAAIKMLPPVLVFLDKARAQRAIARVRARVARARARWFGVGGSEQIAGQIGARCAPARYSPSAQKTAAVRRASPTACARADLHRPVLRGAQAPRHRGDRRLPERELTDARPVVARLLSKTLCAPVGRAHLVGLCA